MYSLRRYRPPPARGGSSLDRPAPTSYGPAPWRIGQAAVRRSSCRPAGRSSAGAAQPASLQRVSPVCFSRNLYAEYPTTSTFTAALTPTGRRRSVWTRDRRNSQTAQRTGPITTPAIVTIDSSGDKASMGAIIAIREAGSEAIEPRFLAGAVRSSPPQPRDRRPMRPGSENSMHGWRRSRRHREPNFDR